MSAISLRLTLEPADLGWSLRSKAGSHLYVTVIGWITAGSSVDAGVPQEVVDLISRTLCRLGRISFLDPESAYRLSPSVAGRMLGRPTFPITTTARAEAASRLFGASDFPWEQRSQLAIITAPDEAPRLDYPLLFELWSETSPDLVRLAQGMRASGYLFPGVDGDFAEVVLFDQSLQKRFIELLDAECGRADIPLQQVSGEVFNSTDWNAAGGRD